MLNKIILQGRLVADPDYKRTTTGKTVVQFRVASDRGWVSADGHRQADFLTCIAWQNTAEFVYKYFSKGDMILLTGRMETRSYQDKSGNNRTAYEIRVENVDFCGSKNSQGRGQQADGAPSYSSGTADDFSVLEDTEDLPF